MKLSLPPIIYLIDVANHPNIIFVHILSLSLLDQTIILSHHIHILILHHFLHPIIHIYLNIRINYGMKVHPNSAPQCQI
jgi:hypothetical protein